MGRLLAATGRGRAVRGVHQQRPQVRGLRLAEDTTWKSTTIVSGDVAQQIQEIKDQTDGDIVISGSPTLVRSLLDDGLVDELRLLVHPITVGNGARPFETTTTHALQLVAHEAFQHRRAEPHLRTNRSDAAQASEVTGGHARRRRAMLRRTPARVDRQCMVHDPSTSYEDRWITCAPDAITIRGYYFPWGDKRIPYSSIRSMRRVSLGVLRGKGRIWGTANPRLWASLDPQRPSKQTAFVLDLGRRVQPFLTPDDPDAFEAAIRGHTNLGPAIEDAERGLLI